MKMYPQDSDASYLFCELASEQWHAGVSSFLKPNKG